jgi:fructokinase
MEHVQRLTIVGLGEILWDVFPDGPRFGGAPANFACHAAALGGRAWMVSAVGTDQLGDSAIETLQRHRVATGCVARLADYPTGQVQVAVNGQGQPRYMFGDDEAWDHLAWGNQLAELAGRTDAVCFGTLGQRSRASRHLIQRFVGTISGSALRVCDINLRPPFVDNHVVDDSLQLANVLKLNDDELSALASRYGLSGSAADQMGQLQRHFELRLVALTRGERGSILRQGDRVSELSGMQVVVKDTVGAGDAFTAAITLGLLTGRELEAIHRHAAHVAAFVCTQSGATPALPDALIRPPL